MRSLSDEPAGRPVRVLLVDDSAVIRKVLSEVLATDPSIEVVGTAANGRLALARIEVSVPDLVLLDVEMPELDGLGTLVEIRRRWPALRVIMFSSFTTPGAVATVDALLRGANDYVAKPSGGAQAVISVVRGEIIPRILALCRGVRSVPMGGAVSPGFDRPGGEGLVRPVGEVAVVAIGSSTGGPNALAEVLPALPANLPVPVLVSQHMPPLFTRFLAERLAPRCALPIAEAEHGRVLVPGRIWLAPGDYHLTVSSLGAQVVIQTPQSPPVHSCRPSVDVMLRSAVSVFGGRILAVILTGMGQDGHEGCQLVRDAGGQVLVQDEATSVVWGMPGVVARAGLADAVLPLHRLGREIVDRVGGGPRAAVGVTP